MKRLTVLLFAIALFLPAAAQSKVLDIQRVETPAGLELWLVEDHSVPVLTLSFAFRGGAVAEPAGREGLARMVANLIDQGAGERNAQAFQSALEDINASISVGAGYDDFSGELKTLTRHKDEAVALLRLALLAPRFDDEAVDRVRAAMLSRLAREDENANRLAGKRWRQMVFPDHAYGRPVDGTEDSLAAITKDDLVSFHASRFARDNLVIAMAGDVTAAEAAALADAAFGDLPAASAPVEIAATRPNANGETLIVRRDLPQSVAIFGQAGLGRDHPDYYAAYLMTHILGGGGLVSRLTEEVREKRGLAYSVGAYLNPSRYANLLVGSVSTKNASARESIDLIVGEWRRMAEEGVSEEELAAAQNKVVGSFLLNLTSTDGIAGVLLSVQLDELGIDYLDRREDLLRSVTVDDIRRVAAKLYDPDDLTIVVVGDPPDLGRPVREES